MIKEEITIRFVTENDMADVIILCEQHAEYEKAIYHSEGKEEQLRKALFSDSPELFCIVAEVKNNIVGYATYMKQFSTWDAEYYIYMDCLYLIEALRGYGIGEMLVNRIKKEALFLNCNLIQWQTPVFNKL